MENNALGFKPARCKPRDMKHLAVREAYKRTWGRVQQKWSLVLPG